MFLEVVVAGKREVHQPRSPLQLHAPPDRGGVRLEALELTGHRVQLGIAEGFLVYLNMIQDLN